MPPTDYTARYTHRLKLNQALRTGSRVLHLAAFTFFKPIPWCSFGRIVLQLYRDQHTMTRLQDSKGDDWKFLAGEYQKLTADVASRPIGTLLQRADSLLPFSKATGILDNGCGPGPVMSRLLRDYQVPASASLTCSDFSAPMIEKVEEVKAAAIEENSSSAWSRVETVVQNAMDLQSIQDSSVSHVTAGWVSYTALSRI